MNDLHRQLSGDPDNPPPAWQRRSSFTQEKKSSSPPGQSLSPSKSLSGQLPGGGTARSSRSPSDASSNSGRPSVPPSSSRRHPHLAMTTATKSMLANGLYAHDSPSGSSSSLTDPIFAPPNPAFRRGGGGGSNRSSTYSDISGMTGDDLWNLPDRSNPSRSTGERPLDSVLDYEARREKSVRRMSQSSRPGAWISSVDQFDMMCEFLSLDSVICVYVDACLTCQGQPHLPRKYTMSTASNRNPQPVSAPSVEAHPDSVERRDNLQPISQLPLLPPPTRLYLLARPTQL